MDAGKTGEFISLLRKEKALTQTELAEKLNISNRTVSKWENGDGYPDITILPELADILGVSVDELLNGEKEETFDNEESIKFEAVYKDNKQNIKSAIKYYYESISRQGSPHLVAFLSGLILYFLGTLNVFHVQYEFVLNLYKWIGIAFIVIAALFFITPALSAFSHLRNEKSKFGEIPQSRCVFSDKIYLEDGEDARGRMYYFYDSITKFIIGKEIYDIVINKKLHIVIPKNSIKPEEQGEFESFIASFAKDIYNYETRKKIVIFFKVLYITCSVVLIAAFAFTQYSTNAKIFYTNLNDKKQYFLDNENEFNRGLKNVQNDKEIQAEVKTEGGAAYYAEKYISLDTISDVEITTQSVCFDSYYGGTKYYSGYVYYEGEGIPTPKDMNFAEDNIDKEKQNYIEDENIYLIGKEKNGTLTKNDWFLAMPITDNWYYCEYH